jgi:hypothetical protein
VEWCKLYANLPDDPRVQAAEDDGAAGWLLVQSFCYVTRAESLIDGEGFIPDTQVRRFGCTSEQVAALVREKLYIRDDLRKGYLLDPEIWNEDRNLSDSAEKKKQADRERMRTKREAARTAQNGDLSRDSRATGRATASRDRRSLDERREEKTRTKTLSVVGVVNRPAGRNARTRDDDDPIITTIIETIYAQTSHVIDQLWAAKIRDHIASRAKTANPGPGYFKAAIEREPDAAKRFLEHDPPPLWCGQCSPSRYTEDPDTGLPIRPCPDCHPSLRKEPA